MSKGTTTERELRNGSGLAVALGLVGVSVMGLILALTLTC